MTKSYFTAGEHLFSFGVAVPNISICPCLYSGFFFFFFDFHMGVDLGIQHQDE